MDGIKIEYLPVKDLKAYENNARKHGDEDLGAIINSIKEFGFNDPIGIWSDQNIIVEGHGRLIAAKRLKMDKVPCIRLDHMTDEQRRAYTLAHNKTAELSAWDFDMVDLEIENIADIDMTQFGFEFEVKEEPQEIIEDEAPEPPAEPKAKPGDLFLLGKHRLICGDSTDAAVIGRLMDSKRADMVFTDPPYGMNLDTDYSGMKSKMFKGGMRGNRYEQGKVDEFHEEMIAPCFSVGAKEVFLWGADYFAELLPNKNDGSWIVWDKRGNGNDDIAEDYSSDKMYGSCFELCWSKAKHKREIARIKWAGIFGMSSQDQSKRFHPTQKPLELCAWFLDKYSKKDEIVVDLFGGSGSTLIACEQLNRVCYMCELDPAYIDVIVQRYINLKGTSEDVFLIRDGEKIPYEEVQ